MCSASWVLVAGLDPHGPRVMLALAGSILHLPAQSDLIYVQGLEPQSAERGKAVPGYIVLKSQRDVSV